MPQYIEGTAMRVLTQPSSFNRNIVKGIDLCDKQTNLSLDSLKNMTSTLGLFATEVVLSDL